MQKIALFDLDLTLMPIDSDYTWAKFTNAIGWTDPEEATRQNEKFYQDYVAGQLDMNAYVRFVTRALREHTPEENKVAQQQYMRDWIRPEIRQESLDLLQKHRAEGAELVLTTATNRFIAESIGLELGFVQEHILCTELVQDAAGNFTGDIAGVPNLREGKLVSMEAWLKKRGWGWDDVHITFYSDSYNDMPLMLKAAVPVPTNPDARLREEAQVRGWPVLELFKTVHPS